MHSPTRLAAALSAGLTLAALAPAAAAAGPSPEGGDTVASIRAGLYQRNADAFGEKRWGPGPALAVAVSRAVTPWLELEASVGWARAEVSGETFLASDPTDPGSPIGQVTAFSRLDLLPVALSARLLLAGGAVRPYLLAGAGAVHARNETHAWTTSGWGPTGRLGAGLDWLVGDRVQVGVEGWWGWSRPDMRSEGTIGPSVLAGAVPAGALGADGIQAQATAGWRF